MDEEVEKEEADKRFEEGRDEKRRRDEEKTEKNRKRRQRKKGKKGEDGEGKGEGEEMKGVRKGPMMKARQIGEVGWGEEEDTGEGDEVPGKVVEEKGVVIHDDD